MNEEETTFAEAPKATEAEEAEEGAAKRGTESGNAADARSEEREDGSTEDAAPEESKAAPEKRLSAQERHEWLTTGRFKL